VHRGRNKEFGLRAGLCAPETLPGDAHYFEDGAALSVLARDRHGASNGFQIMPEAARPVIVGDYRNGMRARIEIVIAGEETSRRGAEPEGAEHPSGYVLDVRFFHRLIRSVRQIRLLC